MWLNIIYVNKKTTQKREFNIIVPAIKTTNKADLSFKEIDFISRTMEFYKCLNEKSIDYNLTNKKGYKNI